MAARPVPAPLKRLLLGSVPIRRGIYIIGMLPATYYFYLGVMDRLGADPQKTLERLLGLWALRFLILTLAVTPLRRLGGPNLVRYRRAMGLLVFYYAAFHLTVYMVLDQNLDLAAIWADIIKRPYITVGMLSFTILLPLAVTSNNRMIRRLGGAAWAQLHRWIYVRRCCRHPLRDGRQGMAAGATRLRSACCSPAHLQVDDLRPQAPARPGGWHDEQPAACATQLRARLR